MKSIVRYSAEVWERRPLALILVLALVVRMVAALFARGYGMHDDHFCVIDVAQQWLNQTLSIVDKGDNVRNLIYPWLHYVLFAALERMGVFDPQAKMLVVRVLHALYSLFLVYFGYKTALLITDGKTAKLTGLLLALLWVLPFMSVRNLIEFVCVPPLAAGIFLLIRHDVKGGGARLLAPAGAMMALAFTFRFQTIVFAGAVGLVFLFKKQWARLGWYVLGFLVFGFVLQTVSDVHMARTYPGASFFRALYLFTVSDPSGYPVGPWYQYLGLLVGVLIPPMSLLLLYGFFKTWKKYALIFWPTFLFLAVHSIIVNKQERFILPIVPFVLMLGVIGWRELSQRWRFWETHSRLVRGLWWWFWVINTVLLCVVSTTYSKKSRVETLTYLSHKTDVRAILIETPDNTPPLAPLFYLTKPAPVYYLPATKTIAELKKEIDSLGGALPNYVICLGQSDIKTRIERLGALVRGLKFEHEIKPSFIDNILYVLNPRHNVNQSSSIYKGE